MDKTEILRVEKYLRSLFRLDTIRIEARPNKKDSVEVMVGDEFIGVLAAGLVRGEAMRPALEAANAAAARLVSTPENER